MATIHILKTHCQYWDAVNAGKKTFEVRRNDRGFQTGDTLVLRRTDENGAPTPLPEDSTGIFSNSDLTFRIGYLLQGGQFGIEPAYCVLGLQPVVPTKETK